MSLAARVRIGRSPRLNQTAAGLAAGAVVLGAILGIRRLISGFPDGFLWLLVAGWAGCLAWSRLKGQGAGILDLQISPDGALEWLPEAGEPPVPVTVKTGSLIWQDLMVLRFAPAAMVGQVAGPAFERAVWRDAATPKDRWALQRLLRWLPQSTDGLQKHGLRSDTLTKEQD